MTGGARRGILRRGARAAVSALRIGLAAALPALVPAAAAQVPDPAWSPPGLDATPVDLRHTFFSRRASWMTLHPTDPPGTLRLVFARMAEEKGNLLDLRVGAGPAGASAIAFSATPSRIAVTDAAGGPLRGIAYVAGAFEAVVDTAGLPLEIVSLKPALALGRCRVRRCEAAIDGWQVRLEVARGQARRVGTAWQLTPAGGRLTVVIRMHQGAPPAPWQPDPARELRAIDDDWRTFLARLPAVAPARAAEARKAWWDLWSLHAPKDTHLATDAVLVAKAEMNAIWAWDHCFPALALGLTDARAGFDQLVLPFHNADASGQLPDVTSPDELYRGVTKPPIHGWTLTHLWSRQPLDDADLAAFYPRLAAWTEFWFTRRDTDGNGFPEYGGEHSGWDSGWDNATVLGEPGTKYETPELQAYLVLQMQALAAVARQLHRDDEAAGWERRAAAHLDGLLRRFWDGRHFLVRPLGGAVVSEPTSLLNLMPLVLGAQLPPPVFARLADDLEQHFLTRFGPATERPDSPHYEPDGYWRGPIWAPATYLLVDGLRRGGRLDLAREIARRFCDMVTGAGGHYENYDALTGRGLRTKGFAWTAAVRVLLLHEYLRTP
ncbi:MAG: trehalase family glycosidase [Vicinamibacterales bacterium]